MVHSLTKKPITTHQVGSPESIAGYKPQTDVDEINAIAYDQRAIETLLQNGDAASLDQARQIYIQGAYSSPYAQVVIVNENGVDDDVGLPFAIQKGQKFTAVSMDGAVITASAFEKYAPGTNTIWLLYDNHNDAPCHVGGLAEPEVLGCLNTTGVLQLVVSYEQQHGAAGSGPVVAVPVAKSTSTLHYVYDYTTDNRNERSIQGFSIHANGKFRPNGNIRIPYMDDFQKFVDYYGMYNYADQIITAAFAADDSNAAFDSDFLFQHGAFVFAGYSLAARREIIARTTAYMATGMFVIREMEHGVIHCDQKCGDLQQLEPDDPTNVPDCMVHPLHSVDSAVALYTGAVQAEDGHGNLLFGLANEQCRAFKTCWNAQTHRHDYIDAGLTAQVNMDILEQFNELQHHLDASNCVEAKVNKRHVAQKMLVPLVQGLLHSVYEMNMNIAQEQQEQANMDGADVLRARSIAMAAAVLPVLAHCNLGDADKVYKAIVDGEVEPEQEQTGQPLDALEQFQLVKSILENQYHCMGITCQDVGGLVDPATGDYISALTAPCGEPVDKEVDSMDDDGVNKGVAFGSMFFIFLAGTLLLCCVLYRRRQRRVKRNYDDDDDDDSLSSIESFD
jgi:hypothetical protein